MIAPAPGFSRYFWQGDRVRLRPFCLKDAEQSYMGSLDSPSRQLLELGVELPTTVALQRVALEGYAGCRAADGVIVFAIETLAGDPAGGIALHSMDAKNGVFGLGVSVNSAHQRKGYATESARILLRYGFWEQRYQKCNSACVHMNGASMALHRRLGFMEEGRRRRQVFMRGQYHDQILWGMTREEFDSLERVGVASSLAVARH